MPVVKDLPTLKYAFMCYGGTPHTDSAMRHAWGWIEQGLTPNEDGTHTISTEAWERAMETYRRMPYGGRWVWKARQSFGWALDRAFGRR